jgi:feruloyl esterase
MNSRIVALIATVLPVAALHAQNDRTAACTALANTPLPNTSITAVETITGGSFTAPGSTSALTNLPPFCRIVGAIKPTAESDVRFEVWLPLDKWNSRYAQVGNGGWAGVISYGQMQDQLRRGYAVASTNTGHQVGPGLDAARFAFEHPEQLVDFAYRAHHETTLKAKALVNAFYGKTPDKAYWFGCSSGGYEGLQEAQRFPADFDGILAAAPANNWTRLMAADFDATLAVLKDPASNLPPSALSVLYRGALAACDAGDGVTDGVLEDPRQCRFDPGTLQCAPNQKPDTCLSPAQVEAARRVYRGPVDPATRATIYPGMAYGSEPFWPNRDAANPFPIPVSHYKWLVFADPIWDWKTFDMSKPSDYQAYQKAEAKFAPLLNATNPDLREFRKRGGKLLQWHGWSDQLIAAQNSIDYYESVVALFGGKTADVQTFYRLFMAPGVTHCSGGPGPNTVDAQAALEEWVEKATAPDQIMATHLTAGVVDRSRPLCPYPQVATYKGKGDTNDAANFSCAAPAKGARSNR